MEPPGFVEVQNEELLASAVGGAGKGMLCEGKVFTVVQPVIVYRVYNADNDYSALGNWWTMVPPLGQMIPDYTKYGICPEWGKHNAQHSCSLKVGAQVVVGPGQSVQCANGALPASPANQLYIPNSVYNSTTDTYDTNTMVEDCSAPQRWPVA